MKVNSELNDLVTEYKAEVKRTAGFEPHVSFKGPWMYIIGRTGFEHTYKRKELPGMIATLKARPSK